MQSKTHSSSCLAIHIKGKLVGDVTTSYEKLLDKARQSIKDKSVARFDILKRVDHDHAPPEFLVVKVFREVDPILTEHDQDSQMTRYKTLFPPAHQWGTCASASKVTPSIYSSKLPWENVQSVDHNGGDKIEKVNIGTRESLISYAERSLTVVLVHVYVLDEYREEFKEATLDNCRASIREGGITRFDLLQDSTNPQHFVLMEVYNSANAYIAHKNTRHYSNWTNRVAHMMAKPRSAEKYSSMYPSPLYWHQSSGLTHPGEGATEISDGARGLGAVSGENFGFLSPRLLMGRGLAASALKQALRELQVNRPLFITGKNGFERYKINVFNVALGIDGAAQAIRFTIESEPTVDDAIAATKVALENRCDAVVAIGGGSAMDLGKAVSALITNRDDIFDYLEVVGMGKSIKNVPVPFIAVPTTSGTGSEATKNAVLKSKTHGRKASIRHELMLPKVAILDPMLTMTCPPDVTAHVGLDTLCQVIEPYCSNAANPITDALCKEAILRASRSIRAAVSNGSDIEAREDLSIASFLGGLALANAKLGAVHGFAAVLGGMFDVAPHGAICAVLTPHVFRKNAERLAENSSSGDILARIRLQRFTDVARIVTGNPLRLVESVS